MKLGIVGHPVLHSISPFIHKRLFTLSKISAEYNLFDILSNNLAKFMPILEKLDGYNVTIPYKQEIIPYLSQLCDKADIYKCVNTVKNSNTSFGYNTDADGFLQALKFEKINLSENVVILGCGGVARIFCFEAVRHGCNVTLAVRNQSLIRAKKLISDVENLTKKNVQLVNMDNIPKNIKLLINATPVGMFPQSSQMPVSPAILNNCAAVFDAIYNPCETLLIKTAKTNGSKVANGLSMLIFQAIFAHRIWYNATFSENEIFQLILDAKEFLRKFG